MFMLRMAWPPFPEVEAPVVLLLLPPPPMPEPPPELLKNHPPNIPPLPPLEFDDFLSEDPEVDDDHDDEALVEAEKRKEK